MYTRGAALMCLCYVSMYACMCPCACVYLCACVCTCLKHVCVCDNVRVSESQSPSYELRQFWELRHGSHVPQTCKHKPLSSPARTHVYTHAWPAEPGWPPSSSDSLSPLILWSSSGWDGREDSQKDRHIQMAATIPGRWRVRPSLGKELSQQAWLLAV